MRIKYTVLCAALASAMLFNTACASNKNNSNAAAQGGVTSEADISVEQTSTAEASSSSETLASSETSTTTETAETTDDAPIVTVEDGNIGDIELQSGDLIAEFEIEGYGTIKAKLFPEIAPVGVDNFVKLAESGYYNGLNIHRVISDFMLQGGSLNGDGTGGEAADGGEFGVEISEHARHFYGALCYANAQGKNTTQFYIVNNKQPQDLSLLPTPDDLRGTAEVYLIQSEMYEDDPVYSNYYKAMADYYNNLALMLENATPEVIEKYTTEGGTPSLDGGHTVFGQVYEGFEVIDSISACEVRESAYEELSEPVQTITITSVKVSRYEG